VSLRIDGSEVVKYVGKESFKPFTCKHASTLKRFMESTKRLTFVEGPYGSGKSSACINKIIKATWDMPPCKDGVRRARVAVVRNTYRQLKDTTIRTFFDWFPPDKFGRYTVSPEPNYLITAIPGIELEINFRALDRPDHIQNVESWDITGAWLNEVKNIPMEIISAINGRIGRYPAIDVLTEKPRPYILMDSNPGDEDLMIYDFFEVQGGDNREIFIQPGGMEPTAENLPFLIDGYYNELIKNNPSAWCDVHVHGKRRFLQYGKPVYKASFDEHRHVAKEPLKPIKGLPLMLGFDFGLTPCCVVGQVTPRGQMIILNEYYSFDTGIERFVRDILKPNLLMFIQQYNLTLNFETDIFGAGDPAGVIRAQSDERTCFDVLYAAGFNVKPAKTNALAARIGAVEDLLSRNVDTLPGMVISPNCKKLIKGLLGGYCFKRIETSGEKYSEIPNKNDFSHGQDALQYLAMLVKGNDGKKPSHPVAPKQKYKPADPKAGY
jgi:hypothetical protein